LPRVPLGARGELVGGCDLEELLVELRSTRKTASDIASAIDQ
jgi:hypothetical protein